MSSQAWRDAFLALLQVSQKTLAAAQTSDPGDLEHFTTERAAAWKRIELLQATSQSAFESFDDETRSFLTRLIERVRETDEETQTALLSQRQVLTALSETSRRLAAEGFAPSSYFTATAVNVRA